MTRRGVQVGVDADHQVERSEQALEPPGVGSRQGRVARDRQQRPHLARAGRLHLVGERRHGQLAQHLGQAAHTAVPAAGAEGARWALRLLVGRVGEHRAARAVEVPGEDVDDVDEPGGEGAVGGRVGADAPVDDGGRGGGQIPRQRDNSLGRRRR